jgi:hypothetical protein
VETVFDAHVDPGLVERSLAASTFGSVWLDIGRPEYPQATGSIACDLLVVGGATPACGPLCMPPSEIRNVASSSSRPTESAGPRPGATGVS